MGLWSRWVPLPSTLNAAAHKHRKDNAAPTPAPRRREHLKAVERGTRQETAYGPRNQATYASQPFRVIVAHAAPSLFDTVGLVTAGKRQSPKKAQSAFRRSSSLQYGKPSTAPTRTALQPGYAPKRGTDTLQGYDKHIPRHTGKAHMEVSSPVCFSNAPPSPRKFVYFQ